MKIRVIGGGPAGLFYAYLMKRDDPRHDTRVIERDPKNATYGWGVVFSDVAPSFVRDLAPEPHDEFVKIRQPGSDKLQQTAIKSTEWYENPEMTFPATGAAR